MSTTRYLVLSVEITLFTKTLIVVRSIVGVLTFVRFSSKFPPAVKRVRYISSLSGQIEKNNTTRHHFLMRYTFEKGIQFVVLMPLIGVLTAHDSLSNSLANEVLHLYLHFQCNFQVMKCRL